MKKHPYFKCFVTEDGQVFSEAGKQYKEYVNEFGYHLVNVQARNGEGWKSRRVHRLVAETFIDNPDNLPEVNHKDCDKSNNCVSNLEWVTSRGNKDHGWLNGLYTSRGELHPDSVLTDEQVHEICRLMEEGARNIDLARAFGVHKDTISRIRIGDNWKHISCQYTIDKKRTERKSPATVLKVAELLELGLKDREISERTGLRVQEINRIRNRQTHKTLTKDYVF